MKSPQACKVLGIDHWNFHKLVSRGRIRITSRKPRCYEYDDSDVMALVGDDEVLGFQERMQSRFREDEEVIAHPERAKQQPLTTETVAAARAAFVEAFFNAARQGGFSRDQAATHAQELVGLLWEATQSVTAKLPADGHERRRTVGILPKKRMRPKPGIIAKASPLWP